MLHPVASALAIRNGRRSLRCWGSFRASAAWPRRMAERAEVGMVQRQTTASAAVQHTWGGVHGLDQWRRPGDNGRGRREIVEHKHVCGRESSRVHSMRAQCLG